MSVEFHKSISFLFIVIIIGGFQINLINTRFTYLIYFLICNDLEFFVLVHTKFKRSDITRTSSFPALFYNWIISQSRFQMSMANNKHYYVFLKINNWPVSGLICSKGAVDSWYSMFIILQLKTSDWIVKCRWGGWWWSCWIPGQIINNYFLLIKSHDSKTKESCGFDCFALLTNQSWEFFLSFNIIIKKYINLYCYFKW